MIKYIRKLINFIYPPVCNICNKPILNNNSVCNECYNKIKFVNNDYCGGCGFSFLDYSNNKLFNNTDTKLCLQCLHTPKLFNSFWYVCIYNDAVFTLINKFKYLDNINIKYYIVTLLNMLSNKEELLNNIDLIIPVPISYKKMLQRKYNHSAIIAKLFAISNKKNISLLSLIKVKHTKNQIQLSGKERINNVKKAFDINKKYIKLIKNANILLIDDVVTTGSTVNECTKVLKKYKAKSVHILCLSRVEGNLKI